MAQPKEKITLAQFRTVLIVAGILIVVVLIKNVTGIFKGSNTTTNQQTYYNGPVSLRGDKSTTAMTPSNVQVPTEEDLVLVRSIRKGSENQVQPGIFDLVNNSLGFDPNAVSTTDPYFYIRMALVGLENNSPYLQQSIVDEKSAAK